MEPKTFVPFCSICLIANVLTSYSCRYLQLYIIFIIIYYRRIVLMIIVPPVRPGPPYMFAFKNSVYLFKTKMYIYVYAAERDFLN